MFRIHILYATTEGHATRITERVAQRLRDKGHVVVESHQANAIPANLNPSAHDGIIVGASIHHGHHPTYLRALVQRHRASLTV